MTVIVRTVKREEEASGPKGGELLKTEAEEASGPKEVKDC